MSRWGEPVSIQPTVLREGLQQRCSGVIHAVPSTHRPVEPIEAFATQSALDVFSDVLRVTADRGELSCPSCFVPVAPSRGDVLEQTPVRSTLAIQLYIDGQELGAFNLFSDTAGGIDEAEEQALNLATHAPIALSGARRNGQFRSALASRDLNGQVKGRLMEQFDLDAIAVFRMIRALSWEMNSPVIGIARQLAFREPLTPDNT